MKWKIYLFILPPKPLQFIFEIQNSFPSIDEYAKIIVVQQLDILSNELIEYGVISVYMGNTLQSFLDNL